VVADRRHHAGDENQKPKRKMKNQTVKQTTAAGNIVWALSKSTLATKTKVGAAKATIKANLKFSK